MPINRLDDLFNSPEPTEPTITDPALAGFQPIAGTAIPGWDEKASQMQSLHEFAYFLTQILEPNDTEGFARWMK